jgi:hypothetical protein
MPRKTLRERREQNPTDDDSNRLREIVDEINGLEKPADMMQKIKQTLPAVSKTSARVGEIYTFVYNAKTPGMSYDPYPLVAVTGVFYWGFMGINFHWGESRQYTWSEIIGDLHPVQEEELSDMKRISYADLLENPSK